MEREKQKLGNVEKFAKNKLARVVSVVALAVVGANMADTKKTEAQTPPPANSVLTNGDFELPNPNSLLPTGWLKSATADPFALHSSGSIIVKEYETSASCSGASSGWVTEGTIQPEGLIQIDHTKTYTLGFWAKYSINPSYPSGFANPTSTINFYKSDKSIQDADSQPYTPSGGSDVWKFYSKTYGPDGNMPWPDNTTTYIKLALSEAGSGGTSGCTIGTEYSNVTIDDASFAPIVPSVGGIAENPDLSKLTQISKTNNENSNERDILIAGVLIGTLAVGAAGVKIRSIKR